MNLNQLRLFYFAARCGSHTRAAETLCLTQPAVSKGLSRLQGSLGLALLEVRDGQVRLTEAGRPLFALAEQIFGAEAEADAYLTALRHGALRRVRISSTESFATYYLPDLVERFRHQRPDVAVTVHVAARHQVARLVQDGEYDLGFLSATAQPPAGLQSRVVHTEQLVLLAAPSHPLTSRGELRLPDLEPYAMVTHEAGSAPRLLVDAALSAAGASPPAVIESSTTESIKHALCAGAGIGFLSERAVERELAAGDLVRLPVAGPPLWRSFAMVWRSGALRGATGELVALTEKGVA